MRKIFICLCSEYGHLDGRALRQLTGGLQQHGDHLRIVKDLCRAAALEPETMAELAGFDYGIACYPRALRALFARHQLTAPKILNLRVESAEKLAGQLGIGSLPELSIEELSESSGGTAGWVAWYPVIDYERCVNCGKCVDFCMFGVYFKDEYKVVVGTPENCKTNCPACARMCPAQAIIFPKIAEQPINGAAPPAGGKPEEHKNRGLMEKLKARNTIQKPPLFKDEKE
ncbi:MAG: 4Fe-4S binding protein [Lentisphaeria bacterium]